MNSCRLNIPYPAVTVEGRNPGYADILLPLYAGRHGELSTLATYTYQTVVTEQRDKRLSDIIECIAMVEMKHYRMLAKMIHMLGVEPVLITRVNRGRMEWWNAQNVLYETDRNKFLSRNIEEEKYCIEAYKNACRKIGDTRVLSVLERIILDEDHHVKIFEGLLK